MARFCQVTSNAMLLAHLKSSGTSWKDALLFNWHLLSRFDIFVCSPAWISRLLKGHHDNFVRCSPGVVSDCINNKLQGCRAREIMASAIAANDRWIAVARLAICGLQVWPWYRLREIVYPALPTTVIHLPTTFTFVEFLHDKCASCSYYFKAKLTWELTKKHDYY